MAPETEQEILIPDYLPPAEIAHYSISYELMSDSLDENPADNFAEKEFEISEVEYARDRGVSEGAFTDFDGEYELGSFFYLEAEDDSVKTYCIHFALSNLTTPGVFVMAYDQTRDA